MEPGEPLHRLGGRLHHAEGRRGGAPRRARAEGHALRPRLHLRPQAREETLAILLEETGLTAIPVEKDKALNERHYGDLQGLDKAETAKKYGDAQVHIWRRSFDVKPPNGESLKDTAARTLPYFKSKILPAAAAGKNVLVAAHGNSLRAIVMELEKLSPDEIMKVNIDTCRPLYYEIGAKGEMLKKTVSAVDHG